MHIRFKFTVVILVIATRPSRQSKWNKLISNKVELILSRLFSLLRYYILAFRTSHHKLLLLKYMLKRLRFNRWQFDGYLGCFNCLS